MTSNKGSATLFAILGTVIVFLAGSILVQTGLVELPLGSGGRTILNDPDAAAVPISLTADVTGVLPQANGGSNASTDFTAGSVIFDDGTRFVQNNSQLFWDNTNFRLGVATVTPGVELSVGGNLLVDATSTVGALFATNTLAVASSSPGSNVQLAVVGHSVLNGNLSVLGVLDSQGTATNTFDGALSATSLYLTQGLRIDVGDLLVDQSIKAATTTTDSLTVNDVASVGCAATDNSTINVEEGNCFELPLSADSTITLEGTPKPNQKITLWAYHNDRSGLAWASTTSWFFVDGKATTTTENLTEAIDMVVLTVMGTSTSKVSVSVVPNFAEMR